MIHELLKSMCKAQASESETLAVNNLGTAILVVLLFCDPHGLEGAEGGKNAAT